MLSSRGPSRAKRETASTETLALPRRLPPGAKVSVEVKVVAGRVAAPVEFQFRRGASTWREKGEYQGEDRTNVKICTKEE